MTEQELHESNARGCVNKALAASHAGEFEAAARWYEIASDAYRRAGNSGLAGYCDRMAQAERSTIIC